MPARQCDKAARGAGRRDDARAPARHELPAERRAHADRNLSCGRHVVSHARPLGPSLRSRRWRAYPATRETLRSNERRARPAAILLAFIAACAAAQPARCTPYTDATLRQILGLGPWPPTPRTDPSNRVSGNAAAIAFGAALFSDRRLSATARSPARIAIDRIAAHTDGLPQARGLAPGDAQYAKPRQRRRPALVWLGWRQRQPVGAKPAADSGRREMGGSVIQLAGAIRANDDLRARYVAVFERLPPADDTTWLSTSPRPWPRTRKRSLPRARHSTTIAMRLPVVMQPRRHAIRRPRAAALPTFVGPGHCIACHSGPRFSNGEFHDVGIAFFVAAGRVDPGRHGGIKRLLASPYNLLGAYSDDPAAEHRDQHAPCRRRASQLWRVQGAVTAQRCADGAVHA